MKLTPITNLVLSGLFLAGVFAILTYAFYSEMLRVPVTVSVTLWLMAIVCFVLAKRMESKKEDGAIGMDSSQLDPVTAAQWLVIGKASAWTGALVGGAYLGMATFVVPQAANLVAASDDLPGVLSSMFGGVALSAAGVYLERMCEVPPPGSSEAA